MFIYWTNLSAIAPKDFLLYENELTSADKVRYQQIQDTQRRHQFLIGRMMIYRFCGRDIGFDCNGKPIIAGYEFNLSHSHWLVGLVVCDTPVGLDIEYIDKNRPYQALAKRLNFTLTNDKCLSFYRKFTQYEADYKCGRKEKKNHHFFNLSNDFISCVSYLNNKEKIKIKEIVF